MFLTVLLILSAIGLSSIAGYYSVAGMTAIFAASWWPIVIMTGTLEFSKIVVSSWLYRNWDKTPRFMKIYFTGAVFILMFITSLGIFGYLSKAHIDQLAGVSDKPLFIQQIDQQITTEQARIDDNRKIILQMDTAVNSMLSQSTSDSAQKANKGVNMARQATALRTSQQKDRANLNKQIDEANAKIRDLNKEKLKLEQEQIKIEAEVGPIKYIAQMIYGDNPDKNLLEKAVRYIIVLIIVVFDPLAILMFMAANMSLSQWQDQRKQSKLLDQDNLTTKSAEPKKKEQAEFIHVDKIEITVPQVDIEPVDTSKTEQVVDSIILTNTVEVESNISVNESNFLTPNQEAHDTESAASLMATDIDEISINDVVLLADPILDPIELADDKTEIPAENLIPTSAPVPESTIITTETKELEISELPLIELVDEILKLAENLADDTPKTETNKSNLQIDTVSDSVVKTNDITYIDGKPINEFLTSPQGQEPNDPLQLVTIPGISKKSDDILSTIKKYHSVRMEDAKRTLR